jgi:hypothetical protein
LTFIEAIRAAQGGFAPTTFLTAYDRGGIGGSVGMIIVTVVIATTWTIVAIAIIIGIIIALSALIAIAFLAVLALIGLVTAVNLVVAGHTAFGNLRTCNCTNYGA